MATIVLSYRRDDARTMAHRIFDVLAEKYGKQHLFIDIDNIPIGADFREHIHSTMDRCDILLAVIGPRWVGGSSNGNSRLVDETDWIRIEIEAALKRRIPVMPLLVEGAQMPRKDELPESLEPLTFRQHQPIDSGPDFRHHLQRVIESIDTYLTPASGALHPSAGSSSSPLSAGSKSTTSHAPEPSGQLPGTAEGWRERIKRLDVAFAAIAAAVLFFFGLGTRNGQILGWLALIPAGYIAFRIYQAAKSSKK